MDVHSLAAAHALSARPAPMNAAAEQRYYNDHAGFRLRPGAFASAGAALALVVLLVGLFPA